jgi:uncharacterized membrane protein
MFIVSLLYLSAGEYYIEFNQASDQLIVKENLNGNQTTTITTEGLDVTENGYYFIKKIESANNYSNFTIRLNLEKGVVVKDNQIFPENYELETNGEIISFVWHYNNIKAGQKLAFFVDLEDTKATSNNRIFLILIILALVFLILFFISRYIVKRNEKKSNIDKYLLDEEKKVIRILKKADRQELWQKNIQKSLSLSKAKCSRLIRNLESRDLIEKIPFGNTNKIRLK